MENLYKLYTYVYISHNINLPKSEIFFLDVEAYVSRIIARQNRR